jgi:hypothetical protein
MWVFLGASDTCRRRRRRKSCASCGGHVRTQRSSAGWCGRSFWRGAGQGCAHDGDDAKDELRDCSRCEGGHGRAQGSLPGRCGRSCWPVAPGGAPGAMLDRLYFHLRLATAQVIPSSSSAVSHCTLAQSAFWIQYPTLVLVVVTLGSFPRLSCFADAGSSSLYS